MDASYKEKAEQPTTEFAAGATAIGELNALLRKMMKRGLETMLDAEMDDHLESERHVRSEADSNRADQAPPFVLRPKAPEPGSVSAWLGDRARDDDKTSIAKHLMRGTHRDPDSFAKPRGRFQSVFSGDRIRIISGTFFRRR
jgi:hypothetical protein